MRALVEFLEAHVHDAVLDAVTIAQLNTQLVPVALAEWLGLQDVLEMTVVMLDETQQVYPWTAACGFSAALTHEHVFALTQQLMLQVGLPTCTVNAWLPFGL